MEHLKTDRIGNLTGEIINQVIHFSSWLRNHGFHAGVPETLTALSSLAKLNIISMEEVCTAFRSIYARTPAEWDMFPALCEKYFSGRKARLEKKQHLYADEEGEGSGVSEIVENPLIDTIHGHLSGYHPSDGERFALRADSHILTEVVKLTQLAVESMSAPPGRKWQSKGRKKIDLRRTIRTSLPYVGEPFVFKMLRRRPNKPRIVLILDISGSMKSYASFFSTLAWSFTRVRAQVQIFLFSTQLLRVTSLITRKSVTGIPYTDLPGLRGGTRIGDSLKQLLDKYPSLLNRYANVMIVSDGFDAGPPEQMHSSMRDLSARVGRIVWINPLLAEPEYEPTATGMSIALPYIDAFLDIHDVVTWRKAVHGGTLQSL